MTDKIQMDWERPDWHLLYHKLLYTVLPWNILDKRTHQKAHTQTMSEAERLREAEDKLSRYRVALREFYKGTVTNPGKHLLDTEWGVEILARNDIDPNEVTT